MKKRIVPIITVAVVLCVFTGVVYAVDKKKQEKQGDRPPEAVHDEETLQAELLAATEEPQETPSAGKRRLKKVVDVKADTEPKHQKAQGY
jgi:hypothetical protein